MVGCTGLVVSPVVDSVVLVAVPSSSELLVEVVSEPGTPGTLGVGVVAEEPVFELDAEVVGITGVLEVWV